MIQSAGGFKSDKGVSRGWWNYMSGCWACRRRIPRGGSLQLNCEGLDIQEMKRYDAQEFKSLSLSPMSSLHVEASLPSKPVGTGSQVETETVAPALITRLKLSGRLAMH